MKNCTQHIERSDLSDRHVGCPQGEMTTAHEVTMLQVENGDNYIAQGSWRGLVPYL